MKAWFGFELTEGQARIVRVIAFLEHRRLVVTAYTRYGKSRAVAVGVCLLLLLHPDPLRIWLVAPTDRQTQIIRGYLVEHLLACPALRVRLDVNVRGADRLKKELSKQRLTFRDGKELQVLSAAGDAQRVMGHGGDVVIVDESCLIDGEVFRSKILRMLGDNPENGVLLELSNPWHTGNHFYDHWTSYPPEATIHVDWRQGVAEGRTTQDFVLGMKNELTPAEFQVLYESVFPDSAEDQLIPWRHILAAEEATWTLEGEEDAVEVYGLDVAAGGEDRTVLSRALRLGERVHVLEQWVWDYADTMQTANRAAGLMRPNAVVAVDTVGLGHGVASRLDELKFQVRRIGGGREPQRQKHRFKNRKAEMAWGLREKFEAGDIRIPRSPPLRADLSRLRWVLKGDRIMATHKGTKSPDYADSVKYVAVGARPSTSPMYA